ncbi:ComEC/Rec2 family competence protein [Chelatococcus composti]|uniref:Competence protein ComEC n=1 Tax=Chelatococcus composti TaxID=1743235 RepID=A0A841K2L8_9HYPH|nr:ComEC/Rec2 family competence protein [Chelatococcus composti]MBB6166988.1 competence protein ComEC [Chelatococcus composti]MBS7737111.1 ComEC/Rec2 family competence protein [Chelatococcus composti]GGG24301.1 competence protein ComEC [Chelatococcus composti]
MSPEGSRQIRADAAVLDHVAGRSGAGLAAALSRAEFGAFLLRCLDEEATHRRLFPWAAVSFGVGVLLYFAADREPMIWAPVAGLAIAAGLAALVRGYAAFVTAVAAAFLFAGFLAGAVRTARVEAPVLAQAMIAPLTGFVESVEERPQGPRMVLRVETLGALGSAERPARVRVSAREPLRLRAGEFVKATARLMPPPGAAWPGGYDFTRDAFFRGIGAVGSLVGPVEVAAPPREPDWRLALAARLDEARNALTARIAAAAGGQAGAVLAALVTGKRGLITEETNEALRAAGLYHIVSISGLHMALAAGTVFWSGRAILALFPAAALTWPIKKIAAAAAMAGASGYCLFSGADVATQRALVMTLIMLGAILADRPALSMRNLAFAAILCLALEPEAVLGPSFQMSFSAVACLVALAEWQAGRHGGREPPSGPVSRALRQARRWTVALVVTTLVASLATGAYGAYHFQTAMPLSVFGNAVALPFVSFVVMPAAVLGMLLNPFGLDAPMWWLAGQGAAVVLAVSRAMQEWSLSVVAVPAFPAGALILFSLALLVLTICVSPLRWLAAVPAATALAVAAGAARPDIYIDRNGTSVAVRGPEGRLAFLGRAPAFVVEQWLRADGDARRPDDGSLTDGVLCDRDGCTARTVDGRMVALVRRPPAFVEDCARADILVTALSVPPGCAAPLVIDRARLRENGAMAIVLGKDGEDRLIGQLPAGERRAWMPALPSLPRPATAAAHSRPPPVSDGRDEDEETVVSSDAAD